MRHGGGAATAGGRGLEKFGDFGLRVEGNVARNFAKRAREHAESGGDFGDAIAMAVPRKKRKGEKKIVSEKFGDLRTFFTEGRQRADRATELQGEYTRASFGQTVPMAEDGIQPACGDHTKSSGKGLLHPGAGGHWS